MGDQLAVGVFDGPARVEEQRHALPCRQSVFLGIGDDRPADDQLHDDVGQALLGHAAVEQLGDVGMAQTGKDLALDQELLGGRLGEQADPHELDRHGLVEQSVGALALIDHAHAAAAEQAGQAIGPDTLGGRYIGQLMQRLGRFGRQQASRALGVDQGENRLQQLRIRLAERLLKLALTCLGSPAERFLVGIKGATLERSIHVRRPVPSAPSGAKPAPSASCAARC